MNYGVLYYKNTTNIGDDIQSYAGMKFLPHIDYLIDRESMNAFESKNHEPVATILNAWFLHNTYNWPPSNDIYPLCIAMHFTPAQGNGYLRGLGQKYLKFYEPVGCRDDASKKLLESLGVSAYTSGCLTLTLPKQRYSKPKKKYICAVDIEPKALQYVKKIAGENFAIKIITHYVSSEYKELQWEQRVKQVEQLLATYQNAECVITSRLHCALPCLAMEVPVLLLYDGDEKESRLRAFLKYLHVSGTKEFCDGKATYDICNPPKNENEYKIVRENLIRKVKKFLCEAETAPLPKRFYANAIERIEWQTRLIHQLTSDITQMDNSEIQDLLKRCGSKKALVILQAAFCRLPIAILESIYKYFPFKRK